MLPLEHSAILLTCIKLQFVIKTFVSSIFEWPLKTNLTVFLSLKIDFVLANNTDPDEMPHDAAFHLGLHRLQSSHLEVSGLQRG